MINEIEYNSVGLDENGKPVIKVLNEPAKMRGEIEIECLDLLDVRELMSLIDFNVKTQKFDNVYKLVDNYDFNHAIDEKTYFAISALLTINNQTQSNPLYYNINHVQRYGDRLTMYSSFIKKNTNKK